MKAGKRALLASSVFAALLSVGMAGLSAKTLTGPDQGPVAASSAFDSIIDQVVAMRVTDGQLPPAMAVVAREQLQMQFNSLTLAEQRAVLAAAQDISSPEQLQEAVRVLNEAVVSAAREALSEVKGLQNQDDIELGNPMAKLGADGDLVFVATTGPCRIADSRFGFGALGPSGAQQLFAYSAAGGYNWSNQGGTGTAGVGNCVGTEYSGTPPVSVVATVSVINTTTNGALQAWNGGTTLSGGAVVNWLAGERLSNTTVIPVNRSIAAYPGSGAKRDFALRNNSLGSTDYVVDVVGYFIQNQATALQCTTVSGPSVSIPSGGSNYFQSPACPAGYTRMTSIPVTNVYGVYTGTVEPGWCRISNTTGIARSVSCYSYCCRIPGR